MWLIGTLLLGLVIGFVAKLLMPGRDPGGFIMTSLLGVAGAIVATYIGQMMGLYLPGEPAGFLAAILGSMLLLFGVRMVTGKR